MQFLTPSGEYSSATDHFSLIDWSMSTQYCPMWQQFYHYYNHFHDYYYRLPYRCQYRSMRMMVRAIEACMNREQLLRDGISSSKRIQKALRSLPFLHDGGQAKAMRWLDILPQLLQQHDTGNHIYVIYMLYIGRYWQYGWALKVFWDGFRRMVCFVFL